MTGKDKLHELWEYCQAIKFGQIFVKIKIHQGEAAEIEEIQPPLRSFRIEKKPKE